MNGESNTEPNTLPSVKQIVNRNLLYDSGNSDGGSGEGWDGEGRGSDVQEGVDMGVPVADSCRCLAETNTKLQSTYPSIKTLKKKLK